MCLVHLYVQCVEILQNYGLQCFYDVGLVSKQTHLKYGVLVKKNIFLFVVLFNKFNFGFWQPIHFHFNPSKKPVIRQDNHF